MLAKKTLAAALQENKEVVGGLIGTVSFNKEGLANTETNIQTFDSSLNRIFKIASFADIEYNSNRTFFFTAINLQNSREISTNSTSIHFIAVSLESKVSATAIRIGKSTNPYGVKIFTDKDSLYFQVTKIGGHMIFTGSNIRIFSVDSLPEDAVEVSVINAS